MFAQPGNWRKIVSVATLVTALCGAARADDLADCEQKDRAYVALQACSKLLMTPDLEPAQKLRVLQMRGHAALSLFYFSDAVEDYTEVLKADPGDVTAAEGRAEALNGIGAYADAAKDLAMVAAKKTDDAGTRIKLGKNLNAAGLFSEAESAYLDAIKLVPASAEAHVGLAIASDSLGKADVADKHIAEALNIDASYFPALMAKAEIAEKRGDAKLAIETYLLAVKANGMQVQPRRALQRLGVETPTPQ